MARNASSLAGEVALSSNLPQEGERRGVVPADYFRESICSTCDLKS